MARPGTIFLVVIVLAVSLRAPAPRAEAAVSAQAGAAARVLQIVYESDTRGYYLPCG